MLVKRLPREVANNASALRKKKRFIWIAFDRGGKEYRFQVQEEVVKQASSEYRTDEKIKVHNGVIEGCLWGMGMIGGKNELRKFMTAVWEAIREFSASTLIASFLSLLAVAKGKKKRRGLTMRCKIGILEWST